MLTGFVATNPLERANARARATALAALTAAIALDMLGAVVLVFGAVDVGSVCFHYLDPCCIVHLKQKTHDKVQM